ncbi:DUF6766 family protein [Sphingomonas sp.]|uniref:DUF6766 family protein n=1 Tax=Sphingomonas sp. TaxID=28214 RepID=UPI00286DED86|nr:DUF6766 family protein [Sphingomonas sp.]
MRRFFHDNGLTIVLLLLFAASLIGQLLSGWHYQVAELALHGEPPISLLAYSSDPQFLAMVAENWESEFLQMAAYVVLTAYLFQRGSSESRDPDGGDARPGDEPRFTRGRLGWLYAHSLGLALFALFLIAFGVHLVASSAATNDEAALHGEAAVGLIDHLVSARFWFESFQNWQSEFFSTAVLIVLSIYLRQQRSPESKAVGDPDAKTGAD